MMWLAHAPPCQEIFKGSILELFFIFHVIEHVHIGYALFGHVYFYGGWLAHDKPVVVFQLQIDIAARRMLLFNVLHLARIDADADLLIADAYDYVSLMGKDVPVGLVSDHFTDIRCCSCDLLRFLCPL